MAPVTKSCPLALSASISACPPAAAPPPFACSSPIVTPSGAPRATRSSWTCPASKTTRSSSPSSPETRDRKGERAMQYRRLGRSGLHVSEVGCGGAPIGIPNYNEVWNPHGNAETRSVIEAIRHAVDTCYNYFDTAPSYGEGRSEEVMGIALEGRRERVHVATKTAWKNRTKEQLLASAEGSLRRLRTDYLDVLQFHGNTGYAYTAEDFRWVMECGPMDAYQQLKREGKIRFVGITCEEPSSLRPFLETGLFD